MIYRAELELMQDALEGLSETEQQQLVRLVDRMLDNFDSYTPIRSSETEFEKE